MTSRALAILDAFDAASPRLSLSEIAERSGTPLTTAHRLLAELTEWGALVRRPDGRYEIGRKLWDLGLLAPVQLELRQVAAPFLLDVHTAIRDTVHLAVRDGLSALYVERISGRESVPVVSRWAAGCRCTPPGSARCCWPRRPPTSSSEALRSLTRPTRTPWSSPAGCAASWPRCAAAGTRGRRRRCRRARPRWRCRCRSSGRGGPVVVAALGIVVPPHRRDLPRLVPVLEVAARGIGRELARTRDFH